MISKGRLNLLAAAFKGAGTDEFPWLDVVNIANEALVTPSLFRALEAANLLPGIPDEVGSFMRLVEGANQERNTKLQLMAREAVTSLNAVGIIPMPLKGLAVAAVRRNELGHSPRMMSDVDLLVSPTEAPAALASLKAAGFRVLQAYPAASPHIIAELGREGDVGSLDLHQRQPGGYGAAQPAVTTSTARLPWLGDIRLLSPGLQIYLTCVHDQFHDGLFWTGGLDIRHLCDIAELAVTATADDWDVVYRMPELPLVRHAVFAQLVSAHRVVGAHIPSKVLRSVPARLHHARLTTQISYPGVYLPLRACGIALKALNRGQVRHLDAEIGRRARSISLPNRIARAVRPPAHPNRL